MNYNHYQDGFNWHNDIICNCGHRLEEPFYYNDGKWHCEKCLKIFTNKQIFKHLPKNKKERFKNIMGLYPPSYYKNIQKYYYFSIKIFK